MRFLLLLMDAKYFVWPQLNGMRYIVFAAVSFYSICAFFAAAGYVLGARIIYASLGFLPAFIGSTVLVFIAITRTHSGFLPCYGLIHFLIALACGYVVASLISVALNKRLFSGLARGPLSLLWLVVGVLLLLTIPYCVVREGIQQGEDRRYTDLRSVLPSVNGISEAEEKWSVVILRLGLDPATDWPSLFWAQQGRLLEEKLTDPILRKKLCQAIDDPNPNVRFAVCALLIRGVPELSSLMGYPPGFDEAIRTFCQERVL